MRLDDLFHQSLNGTGILLKDTLVELRTLAAIRAPEEWSLRWCMLAQQYEERGEEEEQ